MSSGLINEDLRSVLGGITALRIPLAGTLNIVNLLQNAAPLYEKIQLWIDPIDTELALVIVSHFSNVEIQYGDHRLSLDEAMLKVLDYNVLTLEDGEPFEILFGDSLRVYTSTLPQDSILISWTNENHGWTLVQRNNSQHLIFLSQSRENCDGYAVCGAFSIKYPALFFDIFFDIYSNTFVNEIPIFYQVFSAYEEKAASKFQLLKDETWKELGHLDTYFDARRLSISKYSRSFNQIISSEKKSITKSGANLEKIEAEKLWFLNLPEELKSFIPNIQNTDEYGKYDLSLVEAVSINESIISGVSNVQYWENIALQLNQVFEIFEKYHPENSLLCDDLSLFRKSFFIEKTKQRITLDSMQDIRMYFENESLQINNRVVPPLSSCLDAVEIAVNMISNLLTPNIMHGDFFLGNMLLEKSIGQLFLVDPKGYSEKFGIYGDTVYDLAKFSHSTFGQYDYLAANLFYLKIESDSLELKIPNSLSAVGYKVLNEWLVGMLSKFEIDQNVISILEGGLFLGAAALHPENLNRQFALMSRGIERISESI